MNDILKFEALKNEQELFEYMNQYIKYGWAGSDGQHYVGIMDNIRRLYQTGSAADIIKTNIGSCIEQTIMEKTFFDKLGFPSKMFVLRANGLETDTDDNVMMHCFLLYKKDGKVYHFEHADSMNRGIFEYESEDEALKNIRKIYKNRDYGSNSRITELENIPIGLSFTELNEYLNSLKERELESDMILTKYNSFIKEIKSLTTEEEIDLFVMSRLDILEKNSNATTEDKIDEKIVGIIVKNYINSERPIHTSAMNEPFFVNDSNLYTEFVKQIRKTDLSHPLQIFHELQTFIETKFGYKGDLEGHLRKRNDELSIADFYNNSTALHIERSSVVQNLAEFCGIDSFLILGKIKRRDKDNSTNHAYNIFKMNDNNLIMYDVSNPIALELDNGIGFVPAYSIIRNNNIDEIDQVTLDLEALSRLYRKPVYKGEPSRTYYTTNTHLDKKTIVQR